MVQKYFPLQYSLDGQMNRWVADSWLNVLIVRLIDGQADGQMDGQMDSCCDSWIDEWTHRWIEGQMEDDNWIDG